jgi:predicted dinucleotide-binding enzyme
MNIGIIGSGNVGGALGRRFAQAGHRVVFGSRKPQSPEMAELARATGARAASLQDAARGAEVIVLATPWPATEEVLRGLGELSGKVVLDCTNPLKPRLEGLELGVTTSGGEQVAQWAAGARVVKIFNTVGFGVMADTRFPEGAPVMFYCGEDAAAKAAARTWRRKLGFDPVDAGGLAQARLLEPLALLWISPGARRARPGHCVPADAAVSLRASQSRVRAAELQ